MGCYVLRVPSGWKQPNGEPTGVLMGGLAERSPTNRKSTIGQVAQVTGSVCEQPGGEATESRRSVGTAEGVPGRFAEGCSGHLGPEEHESLDAGNAVRKDGGNGSGE